MAKTRTLRMRAFLGLGYLGLSLAVPLCVSAWSFTFWEGWIYLGVFLLSNAFITLYFLKKDPALIERRMKRGTRDEKEKSQKLIHLLIMLDFFALLILAGLDHRFGWSRLPMWFAAVGNLLVATGMLIVFFVFRENSFAALVIQVDTEQKVISTGPYRHVRHPMYSGVLLASLGAPLALRSLCALLFYFLLVLLVVWRLKGEEKFLRENLTGYEEYCTETRYRLVPGVY
jgi:protein-S-isoprenylcysteine O-methyltransferase Ste14